MAGKKLQVNWQNGLKLRTKPEPTYATYTGIKVPHGTVVDAIGDPHQYDYRFSFQQVRTPDGKMGWLTLSYGSTVYLAEIKEEEGAEIPPPDPGISGGTLWVDWPYGLKMREQPEPSMASFTGNIVPYGAQVAALRSPQ